MVTCGTETSHTHVCNTRGTSSRAAPPPCLIQTHTPRIRNPTQSGRIDVSDGVCPRTGSHSGCSAVAVADGRGGGVRHRVLADAAGAGGGGDRARALPAGTRSRAAAGGGRHVELLLVAQQEVASGEASGAFRAFEGLLLGVGSFVTLKVLQACERALACLTDMWSRLVGLRSGLRFSTWRLRASIRGRCLSVNTGHGSAVLRSLRLHAGGFRNHSEGLGDARCESSFKHGPKNPGSITR